ncbi:MAG: GNAT family protein [Verrucomicrobiia bacterium]
MTPFHIRAARPEDDAALFHLVRLISAHREWPLLLPEEELQSPEEHRQHIEWFRAARNRALLIAENPNGDLLGYASACGGQYAIDQLNAVLIVEVSPHHRRRGVATKLLHHLERWARHVGLHRLELTTLIDNEPARHLYEKCGFIVEGLKQESRFVAGRFRDELLFAKILN